MFTTVGWAQLVDPNGIMIPIDAIPDQHVRTEGDSVFIQEFNYLLGGYALSGTVLGISRFVAPSLRRVNPNGIYPVESDIDAIGIPHYAVSPRIGIPLEPNEQLQYESDATLAGAQEIAAYAWLADARITPVEGEIRTLRFTIATTINSVIHGWVYTEIDFVDDLPVGVYDIVGGGVYGASIRAFRFVPIGAHHRPGGIGVLNAEFVPMRIFRFGELGVWATFEQIRPPGLDIQASAVVALKDTEGFMDVIAR